MVQSVERAFSILDAVSSRPAGVTAIAERVHLPKSTVARLLQTLEEIEAVERVDGPRWRIGPGVASLAGTASPERSLVAVARPHLARLVADVGEDAGARAPGRLRRALRRPGRVRQPGAGAGLDGDARTDARGAVRARACSPSGRRRRSRRTSTHGLERLTSHTVDGAARPAQPPRRGPRRRVWPGVARSSRRGSARSPRRCATVAARRSPRCTSTGPRTASRRRDSPSASVRSYAPRRPT